MILLKLSGTLLRDQNSGQLSRTKIEDVAQQIKELELSQPLAIVMGGGSFFRGSRDGTQLGLRPSVGHSVGMLATLMNAVVMRDVLANADVLACVLTALECPSVGNTAHQPHIDAALGRNETIIFAGGAGVPYFTTDTVAIVRALQCGASQVWKATDVDGVYSSDPKKDFQAHMFSRISCTQALEKKTGVIDQSALILARENAIPIRVFNVFGERALIRAAMDENFGTIIVPE